MRLSHNLSKEYLKKKVQSLELENKVQFCGKVSYEEMQQIYKKSDIFIFPSLGNFIELSSTIKPFATIVL